MGQRINELFTFPSDSSTSLSNMWNISSLGWCIVRTTVRFEAASSLRWASSSRDEAASRPGEGEGGREEGREGGRGGREGGREGEEREGEERGEGGREGGSKGGRKEGRRKGGGREEEGRRKGGREGGKEQKIQLCLHVNSNPEILTIETQQHTHNTTPSHSQGSHINELHPMEWGGT